jgi:hypothetical protein
MIKVGFGVSDPLCLDSSSAITFLPNFVLVSTSLLMWMTGISLHVQWPLTSQLHGSFSQREQLVSHSGSNSAPSRSSFKKFILSRVRPQAGVNIGPRSRFHEKSEISVLFGSLDFRGVLARCQTFYFI